MWRRLAGAIERVLSDHNRKKSLVCEARKMVKEYDYEQTGKKYANLIAAIQEKKAIKKE